VSQRWEGSEVSGSEDSIITEVLRRTQLDPSNTQLREALAEMMKEAKTQLVSGGAGRDLRKTQAPRERWVDQVLAHVSRSEQEECPSFWPCMETSQERRVMEMESEHLIWTPTAESAREWVKRAASTVASTTTDRGRLL
jgi:hypothetical protein